jgi:hypothetical protein
MKINKLTGVKDECDGIHIEYTHIVQKIGVEILQEIVLPYTIDDDNLIVFKMTHEMFNDLIDIANS